MTQYKAAWARIVSIADKAHNPYLHSTLILQHQDADPGDQYNFRNYLPPGGIISTLGWDAYPKGTVQDQNPQPTPPAQFMGPAVAASKSVGLPFGFAEFALGTQADRPQWLAEVANYLDNSGALFGTLFDAAGFPWMVLHDSPSIQTWRTAVARSAEGLPVSFPTSAPGPAHREAHHPPTPLHPPRARQSGCRLGGQGSAGIRQPRADRTARRCAGACKGRQRSIRCCEPANSDPCCRATRPRQQGSLTSDIASPVPPGLTGGGT